MNNSHLLIILRNLIRDKSFLILNVLGLTLGISGSLMIFLIVRYETSFEKFHANADRIYRVNLYGKIEGREISGAITAPPQAKVFLAEYPEIEDATRYYHPGEQKVTVNAVTYHEKRFFYADQNFLNMFNFPLTAGNVKSALEKPFSVIVTPATALRLFGTSDVLGKNIVLNNNQVFRITGLAEIPDNTHFKFDYLASFNSDELSKSEFWLSQMLETYILLRKGYSADDLEAKFMGLMDKYVIPQVKMLIPIKVNTYAEFESLGYIFRFPLESLKEMHYNTSSMLGYGESINRIYVYFFSIVAILLIFIACINFMNLSTARYTNRSKEVGVKKVLGSGRNQLIRQFLLESFLIALVSMIISLTIIELILPFFNEFTGKTLSIGYLSSWYTIPALFGILIAITLLSGLYPSFYLSSFNPVEILKSKFSNGKGNLRLRSALVVVQFTITIMLIIGTFIVSAQLRYIRNKDLGFNKENVLVIKNTGDLGESSESFRQEIMDIRGVQSASRSWTYPGDAYYGSTYQIQDDSLNRMYNFEIIHGDYEFIPTLGINIVSGRNFSREFATDQMAVLINESAVKFLGLKEAVGTRLTTPNNKGGLDVVEIIGVFSDVHYKSLHERIEPTLLGLSTEKSNAYTIVKLSGNNLQNTMQDIEKLWKEFLPGQLFEYTFVDKNFETHYRTEIRAGSIFGLFSVMAIFVACLGLLGLSAFAVAKRTKEIGVRKVHGASVSIILKLLSREIIILITISSLAAWPAVYFIMTKWLNQFAYKTNINLLVFLLATFIALIIAILVIVYQSMKTAKMNPVEALKYE